MLTIINSNSIPNYNTYLSTILIITIILCIKMLRFVQSFNNLITNLIDSINNNTRSKCHMNITIDNDTLIHFYIPLV